ncbi:MAG: L,D-transpeptidase family protein [Kordiimonadaceae bacterium]|jgi:L,D-peptidoglycan transpeptidase YkuD (ErfK/YbiS/YcfS/YnhG family)|nr:L,D-transpeptidase family protein [Kordiimonadaceae bacterium]MBT6031700.1 L,D-transpeptidase family protein [Kordiimonadaceae bacterium]
MEIVVTPISENPSRGILRLGTKTYPCALGIEGVILSKQEGDHKSPLGKFDLRSVYYRYDKLDEPIYSQVPVMAILKEDGWCDDPNDPAYNKSVMLPYHASAESLWRDDDLYDVLVVLGYNDEPTIPGKGSAIFIHVARDLEDDDYLGTEGCVSLKKADLLELLPALTPETSLHILEK